MLSLVAPAVERTMKRQVIVRALSGALSGLQAADILDLDPRSPRRWRARYASRRQEPVVGERQPARSDTGVSRTFRGTPHGPTRHSLPVLA